MRIAVDLMGSDSSPEILFQGVIQAAKQLETTCSILVIATRTVIDGLGVPPIIHGASIEYEPVYEAISMAEEPLFAISFKRKSSIVVGMHLLKKRRIDAFVSSGNTGALIASATLQLPHLPGIKRPALLASLPTAKGFVAVLDIGGNVLCKAQHLFQFAKMGAAYQSCSMGIKAPTVGLLNIGTEPKKGTSAIREAYQLLSRYSEESSERKLKFVGNIEGRDVFNGTVDVLVTDGFTGNVLLKTAEGISSYIFNCFENSFGNQQADFQKALESIKNQFNHSEYPGAFLCGIEGIVVKCHGNSTTSSIVNSITGAANLIKQDIISKMHEILSYTKEKN